MGHLHHSEATLRVFGDDLNPDEVSALLGAEPTYKCRKGDARTLTSGRVIVERRGSWRLSASRREPENLDGQVLDVLGQLTQNLEVWRKLSNSYDVDLFCGVFMESSNDGLPLSPVALLALGERGIRLELDIFGTSD